MKKMIIAVAAAVICCSCLSLPDNSSTRIHSKIPAGAEVHLRSFTLKPEHIMDGIAEELPALAESCLSGAGFNVSPESGEDIYELDIFLHMKKWQYEYSSLESVTLRLELSIDDEPAAYRLYTADTDKSIDSFSWTFSLLDNNIRELAKAVYDEE